MYFCKVCHLVQIHIILSFHFFTAPVEVLTSSLHFDVKKCRIKYTVDHRMYAVTASVDSACVYLKKRGK